MLNLIQWLRTQEVWVGPARSDHPGPWSPLEESAPAPMREGPETLSSVVSCLLQADLEPLVNMSMFLC